MVGYIILFIIWSLLMICLGIKMADKDCDNRIDTLERSKDFHKDQKEMVVEYARNIVKENKHLKERNAQLINENEELKTQLDNQGKVTYNYYINK